MNTFLNWFRSDSLQIRSEGSQSLQLPFHLIFMQMPAGKACMSCRNLFAWVICGNINQRPPLCSIAQEIRLRLTNNSDSDSYRRKLVVDIKLGKLAKFVYVYRTRLSTRTIRWVSFAVLAAIASNVKVVLQAYDNNACGCMESCMSFFSRVAWPLVRYIAEILVHTEVT